MPGSGLAAILRLGEDMEGDPGDLDAHLVLERRDIFSGDAVEHLATDLVRHIEQAAVRRDHVQVLFEVRVVPGGAGATGSGHNLLAEACRTEGFEGVVDRREAHGAGVST